MVYSREAKLNLMFTKSYFFMTYGIPDRVNIEGVCLNNNFDLKMVQKI